jgi:UDP-N-acetyl-2-amino-2-deoxyglucuronate dehydrogenase
LRLSKTYNEAQFADAVLNGAKLIAPGAEGIKGLALTNAMHLSSWQNQDVTLPFDEDFFLEELQKRIQEEKARQLIR